MSNKKNTKSFTKPSLNGESKYQDFDVNKRLDTREHQKVVGGAKNAGVDYTGSISNAVDERISQSLGVNKDVVD